jgi:hydroxymethylbilane synthase
MRLRLLSRGSDLAVLQAQMVASALRQARPDLDVVSITRSSEGDRDRRVALWAAADKGLFTADLSAALANGDADVVVHSWKDLPIASHPGTEVVGTLQRADPRDVLLVRQPVLDARPAALNILSSSPRRTWQLETSLPGLLPWPIESVKTTAVRGNIPTRLKKLVAGEGDALVVAKAALDRLLSPDAPAAVAAVLRGALASCRWMVLPLREFPTAPAQGALAIEMFASASRPSRTRRPGRPCSANARSCRRSAAAATKRSVRQCSCATTVRSRACAHGWRARPTK